MWRPNLCPEFRASSLGCITVHMEWPNIIFSLSAIFSICTLPRPDYSDFVPVCHRSVCTGMSGRIHPYFQNILSTNAVTSSTLSTNASSFINRSLNSRRFSQFAPLVVQEITQPERTVTRALEPTSVGRSLDTTSSHPYYQHISTVMTTTDSTYTKVAPVGHRG